MKLQRIYIKIRKQGTQTFNFGKGRIIVGSDYHEALERTGVPAEELKTRWGAQFIRRTHTEGHHYFISNLQAKDVEGWVTLNGLRAVP